MRSRSRRACRARAAARRRRRAAGLRRERRRGGRRRGRGRRRGSGRGRRIWPATSFFVMRPASPLPATRGQVDVVRLGHPARGRRGAFWPSSASLGAACGGGRGGGAGAAAAPPSAPGAAAAAPASTTASTLADLHVGSPSGALDRRQHAGLLGPHFEVDLLGLELDDRLAGGDGLALALQPARDARFDDRFTELGNDDLMATGPSMTCLGAGFASARLDGNVQREGLLDDDALMDRVQRAPSPRTGSRCAAGRRTAPAADRRASFLEHARGRTSTRPCSAALPAATRPPAAFG